MNKIGQYLVQGLNNEQWKKVLVASQPPVFEPCEVLILAGGSCTIAAVIFTTEG